MDRINGENWIDIGGGRRGFRKRNQAAGIFGTELAPAWFNALQEELLHLIEQAGLVPDPNDWTQLSQAIEARIAAATVAAHLFAASGYQKLPSGLILQWATGATDPATYSEPAQTITFPISFPHAVYAVFVSTNIASAGGGADYYYQTVSSTVSNVVLQRQIPTSSGMSTTITSTPRIFAIGS